MKNTLLVLSTAAQSPKAIDVAFERVRTQGGKLIILFIVDQAMTTSIFDRLEGNMAMGDQPGQEVQEALVREYQRQGEQQLSEIVARAEQAGMATETVFKAGDFAEQCIQIIREYDIAAAVVTRSRRSQLSRFIFGSPIKRIQDNVSCDFEIVDLD